MCSGIKKFSKISGNPKLLLKCKLSIIKAYLLSGGAYQCATWGFIPKAAYRKFYNAIIKM